MASAFPDERKHAGASAPLIVFNNVFFVWNHYISQFITQCTKLYSCYSKPHFHLRGMRGKKKKSFSSSGSLKVVYSLELHSWWKRVEETKPLCAAQDLL